jgi:hypothetical protein
MNEHPSQAFWAEMSACEHFVQIYEADDAFMDTLTGFISGALRQGEGAVIIATPVHRDELRRRLELEGFDAGAAIRDDQLLMLDAEDTISQFMVGGWPDEEKFSRIVREILARAGRGGRRVRAFGEMVAVMWVQGYCAATVRLEHLWHQLCQKESFVLFCAYPKSGFTENPAESIARVCAEHSKVFPS